MENKKIFLAPKIEGKRFDNHLLPVELMEDFVAFEQLLFELAKKVYLEENPQRQRVPKGFTDTFSLKLSSIEEGSTIPNFVLESNTSEFSIFNFPSSDIVYFEKARDLIFEVLNDAENKKAIIKDYLSYFLRLGKNLKNNEVIYFQPNAIKKAKLDKDIRKRIILSVNQSEYTDSFSINALIPAIDKSKKTFIVELDDERFTVPINELHFDTINIGFKEYETQTLVALKGVGIYTSQDKLKRIESVQQIDLLDPFDVGVRLNELAKLEDGWYNSEGIAPSKEGLQQFGNAFENFYDKTLPLPAIFPTFEGNVQLEWSVKEEYEISLLVNLKDQKADLEILNLNTNEDVEKSFQITMESEWKKINEILLPILS